MRPEPGDAIEYTVTFRGVVTRAREDGTIFDVRSRTSLNQVTINQVVRILDPKPDERLVVRMIACRGCGSVAGQPCMHKQKPDRKLIHPHQERIDAWIQLTGWTPDADD